DDAAGEFQRDLARAVGAAVEDDDQLVGKAEPRQAVGELGFLVVGDDQRRQQDVAHAASARWRKAHTAASTRSTHSESISVSVVRWSNPGPISSAGARSVCTIAVQRPHGA